MNDRNFTVRQAEDRDFENWLRLRKMLWDETDEEEHRAEMGEIFNDVNSQLVLIAEDSEANCVGLLEASIRPFVEGCYSDEVGYLEGWFVDPAFRRMGVGRLLVENAEAWARSKGCSEMASDAEIGNELGIESHAGLGYDETSRLVHFRKTLE